MTESQLWVTSVTPLGYGHSVEEQSPTRLRLSAGELALALFGLAVFGFGVGVGLEWTGLGWGLVPVAAVLIAFAFALATSRSRGPAPTRPTVTMDSAEAVPRLQPGLQPRLQPGLHIGSMPRPPAMFYYLSATGGAALALTLSGLVMLAVPGEATALVLLVFGVVGWIAVVLVSLRFELRR